MPNQTHRGTEAPRVLELLNLDGRVLRSVRVLLTRPGQLTAEHFAGRRARYLSPLRLYLLFSVSYFAVDALMPNPDGDASDAARAVRAPHGSFSCWCRWLRCSCAW